MSGSVSSFAIWIPQSSRVWRLHDVERIAKARVFSRLEPDSTLTIEVQ
jgi:hypothetical protein